MKLTDEKFEEILFSAEELQKLSTLFESPTEEYTTNHYEVAYELEKRFPILYDMVIDGTPLSIIFLTYAYGLRYSDWVYIDESGIAYTKHRLKLLIEEKAQTTLEWEMS